MEKTWKVTVWGVRGSMPVASGAFLEYGGNTACISVDRGQGGLVVFDAGSGLVQLGESLGGPGKEDGRECLQSPGPEAKSLWRDSKKRVHILLSHLHMDHVIGLFGFRLLNEADAKIHIYGQGRGGSLKRQLETLFSPPYWPLTLSDLNAQIQIHEVGPGERFYLEGEEPDGDGDRVAVDTLQGDHPGGSLLYRLACGDKSIVHALDCELDQETADTLTKAARGCSLLIWDASFTKKELEQRKGWGHSCWEQGIGLRQAAGAKLVMMTHYSPGYKDGFLKEQERLARAQDLACLFAREGMEQWV